MLPDPQDTIVGLSSAPGPGRRAIIRLSGASSFRLAATVFVPSDAEMTRASRRRLISGRLRIPAVTVPVPADLYFWPAPRTYTGQDLAEIHTVSCPPLTDAIVSRLLDAGGRAAQPGEFTLRAFLGGKLDLTRAEAVLGVIEAGSRDELKEALGQLAGGMARPLQQLRDNLLDLLADVEAGLDFVEEDIHFVSREDLLARLADGLAQVTLLQKQLIQRAVGHRPFRVVLAGQPNAGKSSLFNALAGAAAALVSSAPGTTRDYLVRRLEIDQVPLELVDTAGWHEANGAIAEQAQSLGRSQVEHADLLLLCLEAGKPITHEETTLLARKGSPDVVGVATKCDLVRPSPDFLTTSALTGDGLDRLRKLLLEKAQFHFRPALAPSLSRCRHHVEALLEHLRRSHASVLYADPPEILALELRGALQQLGEMVGAVYTDDLLDRVFSRFCIGK
jgi:tRNA modification GTPase